MNGPWIFLLFAYCVSGQPCANNLTVTQMGPYKTQPACELARKGDFTRIDGINTFTLECIDLRTGTTK